VEEKRLIYIIHGAIFNKDVKGIKEVKDFFKNSNGDISKLDFKIIKEQKEVFEWIFEHPNYDFNGLFDNYFAQFYSNKELLDYFKIYYKRVLFLEKKYSKKEFFIKPEDFK